MGTVTGTREMSRPPAVAGQFYPANPTDLVQAVRTYIAEAEVAALSDTSAGEGRFAYGHGMPCPSSVRAIIAPHASYPYSGPVAGFSYKALAGLPPLSETGRGGDKEIRRQGDKERLSNEPLPLSPSPCLPVSEEGEYTVFLMGPTHWWSVNGVGLCSARTFETPLGQVPVATDRVAWLLEQGEPYRIANAAHQPEHCLEVHLPFLQVILQRFRIVPMLFDGLADPAQVGADLAQEMADNPHGLIVVSSDLSHFYPYAEAVRLDRAFLADVVAGNREAAARGEACGLKPILSLMVTAEILGWTAHLLDYRNSGDTAGPKWEVVGYGAVAYTASN